MLVSTMLRSVRLFRESDLENMQNDTEQDKETAYFWSDRERG